MTRPQGEALTGLGSSPPPWSPGLISPVRPARQGPESGDEEGGLLRPWRLRLARSRAHLPPNPPSAKEPPGSSARQRKAGVRPSWHTVGARERLAECPMLPARRRRAGHHLSQTTRRGHRAPRPRACGHRLGCRQGLHRAVWLSSLLRRKTLSDPTNQPSRRPVSPSGGGRATHTADTREARDPSHRASGGHECRRGCSSHLGGARHAPGPVLSPHIPSLRRLLAPPGDPIAELGKPSTERTSCLPEVTQLGGRSPYDGFSRTNHLRGHPNAPEKKRG